jgi:hypothetical protein
MPDPTGACVDSTALCETAICTGDGGCTPAAAMTTCAAASCVGSTLTPTRACDGVSYGGCPSMGSGECPSHLSCLDATSCRAGQCTVGADCAGGYCCKAGACVDDTQSSSCGASCSDCSGAISGHVCVAGGCGCNSNLDCGANLPECDFATHRCVECVSSDQCSSARPVCKNGVCSGCKNMNDCNNAPFGGSCNMGTGACLCQSNLDCLSTRAPTCVAGSCGCGVGGPCAVGHACAAGICQ